MPGPEGASQQSHHGPRSTDKHSLFDTPRFVVAFILSASVLKRANPPHAHANEINQQIAVELLESEGATVKVANNGREAVEVLSCGLQSPPFDRVLMDLQMPEMGGYQATAKTGSNVSGSGWRQPRVGRATGTDAERRRWKYRRHECPGGCRCFGKNDSRRGAGAVGAGPHALHCVRTVAKG